MSRWILYGFFIQLAMCGMSTDLTSCNMVFGVFSQMIAIDEEDTEYSPGDGKDTGSYTSEEHTNDSQVLIDYEADYNEIYDLLDIQNTEKLLSQADIDLDLSSVLDDLIKGDGKYIGAKLFRIIKDSLINELTLNKNLMVQVITIVLIGSIFVNLATSFGTGFVSENGFYITYLIITSIMLISVVSTIDMASRAIEKILTLVKILVPLYALAMNFVGQTIASVGMYEIVMVGIWIVQVIILRFIIPMIKFYVILSLINNLNQEDNFSKMCNLIMNIVNWILKTVVYFIVGMNLVKGMIEPQIDALGRTTVNRVATLVPGGSLVTALTGTFLGAGMVVKNSVGVAGIIIILLVILVPIIKVAIIMLTIRLTSAMIQPIGEKRFVDGIESLAKGNQMLIQTMFSSVVLFMITLAIVSYSAKSV